MIEFEDVKKVTNWLDVEKGEEIKCAATLGMHKVVTFVAGRTYEIVTIDHYKDAAHFYVIDELGRKHGLSDHEGYGWLHHFERV